MKTRLLLNILLLVSSLAQAQIFVNLNATGTNDGSSWTNAYTDLNSALSAATVGNEIWIAQGIYKPGTSRSATFNFATSGLKVYGGFNGTETLLNERNHLMHITILSGDLSGNDDNTSLDFNNPTKAENSLRIAQINANNVELHGLVIDGGNANGNTTESKEGSALAFGSAITSFKMYDSEIRNHINERAGAIRVTGTVSSIMQFERIDFHHNLAKFAICAYVIATNNGINEVYFTNSKFTNNETKDVVTGDGGASVIWARGTASIPQYRVYITNCTIANNHYQGTNNPSNGYPSFAANSAGSPSIIRVYNSIFNSNTRPGGNANSVGTFGTGSLPGRQVRNSFAADNFGNVPDKVNTSNTSPGFTDAANGNYTLAVGGSAINYGDTQYVGTESSNLDLALKTRISGISIDIGAYEFQVLDQTFVSDTATGLGDGTSWANAYNDINTAIAQNPGIEIWVKAGTYYPGTSNNNSITLSTGISIYGGFDGTETLRSERNITANPTIFSGDINQDDGGSVSLNNFSMYNNSKNIFRVTGSDVIIDGVTIERGYGTEGTAITVGASSDNFKLVNTTIRENMTKSQGAVSVRLFRTKSFAVENCVFDGNVGRVAADIYAVNDNSGGTPLGTMTCNIYNSLFKNSRLEAFGSTAPLDFGASIWFRNLFNSQTGNIVNCTFTNINTPLTTTASGNVVAAQTNNTTTHPSSLFVYNTIFWNNKDGSGFDIMSIGKQSGSFFPTTSNISNSLSPDGFNTWPNTANIATSNPMFANPTNDFTLSVGSPAIDSGNNNFIPSGITEDLNFNPRIFNTTVDMGAYEFNNTLNVIDFDIIAEEIIVYPNPTSSILNIKSKQEVETVTIYSILGKEVLKAETKTIDVSNLAQGVYVMKIISKDKSETVKRFLKK